MGNIVISDRLRIPSWVDDFASFRRWIVSEDFPDHGWYSHLNGELWVDVSMEKLWHNQIKAAIAAVLSGLVLAGRLGKFMPDRMFLTNVEVGLSTEPDGMFISSEALARGRVKLLQGDDSLEVIGSPDMTLEVVSPTSVDKDTVVLRELYWKAGVAEYWLVQKANGDYTLEILRRTASGFSTTRPQGGWIRSKVFGKSFRLVQELSENELSDFRLEMR